jgi:hypothetical protein
MSGSQTIVIPITSNSVDAVTTGFATSTAAASLPNNESNGGSSGLTSTSKKIIGGVVGGVLGAIILGVIATLYFRLRRKRQDREAEEEDYLTGGQGEPLREKRKSEGGNTPFQSTLDQYHNPAGKPNAASNF